MGNSNSKKSYHDPDFNPNYLQGAEKLICITGWAVWDKLLLFRAENLSIDNRTLGELLIDKAENQGVQVSTIKWQGAQQVEHDESFEIRIRLNTSFAISGVCNAMVRKNIWRRS